MEVKVMPQFRTLLAIALFTSALGPAVDTVRVASAQGTAERPPSITVVGESEVHVQPDMATVTVGVTSIAPSADEAMGGVSLGLAAILAGIRGLGIPNSDIQTAALSLQPIYRPRPPNDDSPTQIQAYRASNNVSVIVRDLARASSVLDVAVQSGANNIGGIAFSLSDPETPRRQALAQATANAEAKATAIAQAAGVSITGIISISEESTTIPLMRTSAPAFAGVAPMAAPAPPVESGEMIVRATVRVTYSI
jgi:uncharacterized protein YggE